jgi:thioredoxin reductase (NADPH)
LADTKNKGYDIVIIGGGPAGLSAGIYTARSRLTSLLIEKEMIGGKIVNAVLVENYPGFPQGIGGYELTQLMHQQATRFGLKTLTAEVTGLEVKRKQKIIRTNEGDFTARAIIVAGGSKEQTLGVPGEREFTGRGVSYCATCDAALFADLPVTVVGGGNAALYDALQAAKFASSVVIIHRRQELRATPIVQEQAFAEPKIKFLWNTVVESVDGADTVKSLKLRNVVTGEKSTLEVGGVFVAIGFNPNSAYLKGLLPLDEAGYIITNEKMETSVPGILAAGDIRSNSIRQTISAAGDGATAAVYAERYLTGSQ